MKPFDDLNVQQTLSMDKDPNIWEVPDEELEVGTLLGSGNFGTVNSGTLRGEIPVAVKQLKKDNDATDKEGLERERAAFKNETDIMKKLNNLYVARIYGICVKVRMFLIIGNIQTI